MVIVETRLFTKKIRDLLDDESYRRLQNHLVARPSAGAVIPGTGGLRKIRWEGAGKGRRGGTRIIYFSHPASGRLMMLYPFGKNEQDDLTAEQKRVLKQVIQSEYP